MKAALFPGQGSQFKGMGRALFAQFAQQTKRASDLLGYAIDDLCLQDTQDLLGKTEYTQPAIYVVNALSWLQYKQQGGSADVAAGHSLGEYNALFAAGGFDFETGLRLVQRRGQLMGRARNGGMLALVGADLEVVRRLLIRQDLQALDIANFNTPSQVILSGPKEALTAAEKACTEAGIRCLPLAVSAAFHSRYMREAAEEFAQFVREFTFEPLRIPVVANATAQPYEDGRVPELLVRQIRDSVYWTESVQYLLVRAQRAGSELEVKELGENPVLSRMVAEIRKHPLPSHLLQPAAPVVVHVPASPPPPAPSVRQQSAFVSIGPATKSAHSEAAKPLTGSTATHIVIAPESLGDPGFRKDWGLRYAYLSGAMYRGISSKELVVAMGRAGFMGFLGTGGMEMARIAADLRYIREELGRDAPWGANLLCNVEAPQKERETVEILMREGVTRVEAAAFMQITPALAWWRISGLRAGPSGETLCDHHVLAKISRPEVARVFMSPAPAEIVTALLKEGRITALQARLAATVPMSHDLCVEADSGGHTDQAVALAVLPSMQALRDTLQAQHRYRQPVRVGLAGGIGTPHAIVAAFAMGAAFVMTGSINQCTVEAGTSDVVKDMLQEVDVQDTDYAPAGDMFELGARVQVLRKGVFFPARGSKLYEVYKNYASLEDIPPLVRTQIEQKYFGRSFDSIWQETRDYLASRGRHAVVDAAESQPKARMAWVFKWYFRNSTHQAMAGNVAHRVNFQIHTGPAMGAFNQWVKGTRLENWRSRRVADVAEVLIQSAAQMLAERVATWLPQLSASQFQAAPVLPRLQESAGA